MVKDEDYHVQCTVDSCTPERIAEELPPGKDDHEVNVGERIDEHSNIYFGILSENKIVTSFAKFIFWSN